MGLWSSNRGHPNDFNYRLKIYYSNVKDLLSYVFWQVVPHFPSKQIFKYKWIK